MSRRSRLHYTLTTIGYGASRMKARLPRSTCLLGDSLSFGAAVRYKLPSHTTSRQNQTPQPQSLGSVRAIAFRSWLPPIGPIKDSHLQSLRHARRNLGRGSASLPRAYRQLAPLRTLRVTAPPTGQTDSGKHESRRSRCGPTACPRCGTPTDKTRRC